MQEKDYYGPLPGAAEPYTLELFALGGTLAVAAEEAAEAELLKTAILELPRRLLTTAVPLAAVQVCRLLLLARLRGARPGLVRQEIEDAVPGEKIGAAESLRVIGRIMAAGNITNIGGDDRQLLISFANWFNPDIDRVALGGQIAFRIVNSHMEEIKALDLAAVWWHSLARGEAIPLGERLEMAGAILPGGRGKRDPVREAYSEAANRLIESGVSKSEAAKLLGVTRPTIYSWLS